MLRAIIIDDEHLGLIPLKFDRKNWNGCVNCGTATDPEKGIDLWNVRPT